MMNAMNGAAQPDREDDGSPRKAREREQYIASWVEQKIQQAQRRGDFNNLPGAGKPLKDLDKPHDTNWWVNQMVRREKVDPTTLMHPAMGLRRERSTFPESLAHLGDEADVRAALVDFNDRVIADRKKPYFGNGMPPVVGRVDVEEMLQRWRDLKR